MLLLLQMFLYTPSTDRNGNFRRRRRVWWAIANFGQTKMRQKSAEFSAHTLAQSR